MTDSDRDIRPTESKCNPKVEECYTVWKGPEKNLDTI